MTKLDEMTELDEMTDDGADGADGPPVAVRKPRSCSSWLLQPGLFSNCYLFYILLLKPEKADGPPVAVKSTRLFQPLIFILYFIIKPWERAVSRKHDVD